MKSLFKILTPTISTIGIATIALTSCGTPKGDFLVAIPSQYLNIKDNVLDGLKKNSEGELVDLAALGYSKVTIGKSITSASMVGNNYIGYKAIKKIDYESGSVCVSFTITALPNLEYIVLPPKLSSSPTVIIPIDGKLNTLDISNVEDLSLLKTKDWIKGNSFPTTGTLIAKKSTTADVTDIITNNQSLKDWSVVYK